MRVRLQNIHKSFGPVEVVRGLDLEVADGEFLVLLGASGSGKTTALRMIAGLESVTSGHVLIGDRDVTDVLPKYRDVAMVFQSYALYPHMTVFANIAYPLTVRKSPKAEIDESVKDVARQVQLDTLLDRYPRQLSGGQRQRVALARAMIRRPAAFLMDEPLSNLDAKLRGYMRAELKHMQHNLGITTIYVTHDQVEAMTLAHRVALLDKGVLQQLDTPANIYNTPANLFVAGFIGSPPMNFIDGALVEGRFTAASGSFATSSRASSSAAVAGVRPEDCRLTEPSAGKLAGEIYTTELMGDHTLVTCRVGGATVIVKADKTFNRDAGEAIGVGFEESAVHLFAKASGDRIV
jgi:multiple sugar transport system ATP-binding protein